MLANVLRDDLSAGWRADKTYLTNLRHCGHKLHSICRPHDQEAGFDDDIVRRGSVSQEVVLCKIAQILERFKRDCGAVVLEIDSEEVVVVRVIREEAFWSAKLRIKHFEKLRALDGSDIGITERLELSFEIRSSLRS